MFEDYDYEDDDISLILEKYNIPTINTEVNEMVLEWVEVINNDISEFENLYNQLKSREIKIPKSQLKFILDATDIQNKLEMNNLNKIKEFIF